MKYKFPISNLQFPKDKFISLAIFVILGFIALQVPFSQLAGSKVKFTLFDLFAPASGAFLGSGFGILAVFLMQIVNLAFHGFSNLDRGAMIRLFPILFGVLFFAQTPTLSLRVPRLRSGRGNLKGEKRDSFASLRMTILLVPLLAIISWNLNPIGRTVWYYSLFWTIPYLVYPVVKRSVVARSLASTFVAHSVGGAIWIWAFNLPVSVWQGLIPVVALERSIMTLGIAASYILMNNVVAMFSVRIRVLQAIKTDSKYIKSV